MKRVKRREVFRKKIKNILTRLLTNRLDVTKYVSFVLVTIVCIIIVFGSYELARGIVISAEVKVAKNLKQSVENYLRYKLMLVEVQANSFANNEQIVKLYSHYNSLDDFEKYSIDTAVQQYLNSISDTSRIISFIVCIPVNPKITPQLRGQSPYSTNNLLSSRDVVELLKKEGWNYIPQSIEFRLGASKEDTGNAISYVKFIKNGGQKSGVVIFGVAHDVLNELLSESFQNSKEKFAIKNMSGVLIYENGKVKGSELGKIGDGSYKLIDNKLFFVDKFSHLPLEIIVERNISFKGNFMILFIAFLVVLFISWFVLSRLINSVKRELKLVGDFLIEEKLSISSRNLILEEFFNSAQMLIATKREMIEKDKEIANKLNSIIEKSLKNVNLMFYQVQEIEKELKGIEGIWSKFKELFLSIFENISKMKMGNERFEKKFNESIEKSYIEIQGLEKSISLYSKGMASVEENKKIILEKFDKITNQMGKIREIAGFKDESLKYIEELDIISLNVMIKTAKDETNKVLNTISQQLIFMTRYLKNSLLQVDKKVKELLELHMKINVDREFSIPKIQVDLEQYFGEIDVVLQEIIRSVKLLHESVNDQKYITDDIFKNYNLAFDKINEISDCFYSIYNHIRLLKEIIGVLKESFINIKDVIADIYKYWSD